MMMKKSSAAPRRTKKDADKTRQRAARNGFSRIRAAVEQLIQVQDRARQLGLFTGDRELLSCSRCGIEEDVTFEGYLIVAKPANPANPGVDIGLRFSEVDAEKGLYRCPGCRKEVVVSDGVFYE